MTYRFVFGDPKFGAKTLVKLVPVKTDLRKNLTSTPSEDVPSHGLDFKSFVKNGVLTIAFEALHQDEGSNFPTQKEYQTRGNEQQRSSAPTSGSVASESPADSVVLRHTHPSEPLD